MQNYPLNEAQCEGLATACSLLDPSKVNRIMFDRNGITGKQFSKILDGLSQLPDLKSIVYRRNGFTRDSLQSLQEAFTRKVPFHLEELKLIDLKISHQCCGELLSSDLRKLKVLALVNVNMSDRQFALLIDLVKESDMLRQLDVSWCGVSQSCIARLFAEALKGNTQLTHLALAYNELHEQTKQRHLSEKEATRKTLTQENQEVIDDVC